MTQKTMHQSKLILFLIALFTVTSAYLFFVDSRDNSLDFRKDWWVVYFNEPKDDSLDFVIENHSEKNKFHWEALDGKNKIDEGNVEIDKGDLKLIFATAENMKDKKMTIQVSDGAEKKEIYKNFEN